MIQYQDSEVPQNHCSEPDCQDAFLSTNDTWGYLMIPTIASLSALSWKTSHWPSHRHLRNIDCLMVRTACLVCFINTVNSHSKKRKKRSLLQAALVAVTQQNLSSLYYLDVYWPSPLALFCQCAQSALSNLLFVDIYESPSQWTHEQCSCIVRLCVRHATMVRRFLRVEPTNIKLGQSSGTVVYQLTRDPK
jgi:hypothetical protein